jgi:rod shape determining protein RodA
MATTFAGRTYAGATRREPKVSRLARLDWTLLFITAALVGLGLVAIYSAEWKFRHDRPELDAYKWVKRQGLAAVPGALAMTLAMAIDFRALKAWAGRLYLGTCGMLVLVLKLGVEVNGARAWFRIGSFQLQPSEFAKISLIWLLAVFVAESIEKPGPLPFDRFVICMFILIVPIAIVMLQPDFGTASVFVVIFMAVLLVGKARARHIALISAMSVITIVALYVSGTFQQYQVARLASFAKPVVVKVDPNAPKVQQSQQQSINNVIGQVNYAKQAISLGGLHGQGFAKGPTTNGGYIAEQKTDFIFSAIGEQFGLIGTAVLLGLYLLMLFRMFRIAQVATDMAGTLFVSGAMALFVWHIFENVGMNMGIMPVTGIPLPLISYGGSSLIAFLLLIGMVESVYIHRDARD